MPVENSATVAQGSIDVIMHESCTPYHSCPNVSTLAPMNQVPFPEVPIQSELVNTSPCGKKSLSKLKPLSLAIMVTTRIL